MPWVDSTGAVLLLPAADGSLMVEAGDQMAEDMEDIGRYVYTTSPGDLLRAVFADWAWDQRAYLAKSWWARIWLLIMVALIVYFSIRGIWIPLVIGCATILGLNLILLILGAISVGRSRVYQPGMEWVAIFGTDHYTLSNDQGSATIDYGRMDRIDVLWDTVRVHYSLTRSWTVPEPLFPRERITELRTRIVK